MTNYINRAEADAVSREEYEETDGVITIEKQSAKDVGEIKHIVIHSPNYTKYFYNESMPISNELPNTTDCTNFILWLLDEIMDEDNWELNAVAYGEIIARKLKKLGLLEVKDGYYVRVPSADAEQTEVVHKPDYSYEADMYKRFTELVENRENHSASVRRKKYYIAGQITGRSASEVWLSLRQGFTQCTLSHTIDTSQKQYTHGSYLPTALYTSIPPACQTAAHCFGVSLRLAGYIPSVLHRSFLSSQSRFTFLPAPKYPQYSIFITVTLKSSWYLRHKSSLEKTDLFPTILQNSSKEQRPDSPQRGSFPQSLIRRPVCR